MNYYIRLVFVAAATLAGALGTVQADPPKVEKRDNHWSPLLAEVTFRDPKLKPVRVLIYGVAYARSYTKHAFHLTGNGDADASVWLDTIREIKQIDDQRLTIVFKDDTEKDYRHRGNSLGGNFLMVYHDNDTEEHIPILKVKSVKFLSVPRRDKEKLAMFNHWRYSPFTGEKLPAVAEGK